jgi:hypothetical protein
MELSKEVMSKSEVEGLEKRLTVEAPRSKQKNRPDSETVRDKKWFGMRSSPMDVDTKYTLALLANR